MKDTPSSTQYTECVRRLERNPHLSHEYGALRRLVHRCLGARARRLVKGRPHTASSARGAVDESLFDTLMKMQFGGPLHGHAKCREHFVSIVAASLSRRCSNEFRKREKHCGFKAAKCGFEKAHARDQSTDCERRAANMLSKDIFAMLAQKLDGDDWVVFVQRRIEGKSPGEVRASLSRPGAPFTVESYVRSMAKGCKALQDVKDGMKL